MTSADLPRGGGDPGEGYFPIDIPQFSGQVSKIGGASVEKETLHSVRGSEDEDGMSISSVSEIEPQGAEHLDRIGAIVKFRFFSGSRSDTGTHNLSYIDHECSI